MIPLAHHPRVVIGRAAEHHPVDPVQVAGYLVGLGDAAIDDDDQIREVLSQTVGQFVAQRRYLP
ncbi:hypothetical protein RZS08_43935, partial [Arthrospira platensis SPKY1]|nr:hypothetical protein [Arthrospira platensis SPKY1]